MRDGKKALSVLLFVFFCCSLVMFEMVGVSMCAEEDGKRIVKLQGGDYGFPSPFSYYPRGPGHYKMKLIFDSLVEKNETDIIPWLAESWEISDDGLTYTFHLRDDVKWHDGEKFTADDVVFTIQYFQEHRYGWADLSLIVEVEKVDDYTVKMICSRASAPFISRSIYYQPIIPKHIWESVEDPLTYHEVNPEKAVIGTGPYKLVTYDAAQGIYLFRENKDYWYCDPAVDEIQFNPISAQSSLLAFVNGEIDAVTLDADSYSLLPKEDKYVTVKTPAFWGYKLYFQMDARPELKQKALRQAIAYAIDREDIVDRVGLGLGLSGNPGYLTKSHVWYNPDVKQYPRNITKAKELIESLGYTLGPDGFYQNVTGHTLEFRLLTGTGRYLSVADEVKTDLEEAGIKIEIQTVEGKTKDSKIKKGEYELAINGHGGWGGDPDLLRTLFHTFAGAPSAYTVVGYDIPSGLSQLLIDQYSEMNSTKRKQMVFKIQEILAEEMPILPLWNTQSYFVYNKAVHDGWFFPFDHHVATHPKLSYLRGVGVTADYGGLPTMAYALVGIIAVIGVLVAVLRLKG